MRLRDHFLAGAAFAQHEHGGVRGGHFADGVKDRLHLRAGAQHAFEGLALQLLHLAVFPLETRPRESALEQQFELFHVHRLGQEIVGAGADGLQRVVLLALTA